MNFIDLMTNPGLYTVNLKILNSLNLDSLKNLCRAAKELEDYIKEHCQKWTLLLQIRKSATTTRKRGPFFLSSGDSHPQQLDDFWDSNFWDQQNITVEEEMYEKATMVELLGKNVFEYFEEHGTNEELALFLEFIQAYLQSDYGDMLYHDLTNPFIDFAIVEKRIDFVNLMIPTPLYFDNYYEGEGGKNNFFEIHKNRATSLENAVTSGDIEMVKLLLRYSSEKHVNLDINHYNTSTRLFEKLPILATRLGYHNIAQLLVDVYDGKIDVKDLKPVIKK